MLPRVGRGSWIHDSARVIGDVVLGDNVSIWCGAVIRGDVNSIRIGAGTNIQDNSVLHVSHKTERDPMGAPLMIGANVTVGHSVILHGCTISDECLIGMGSIVMDKVMIEPRVLLGAGSLVPEGKVLSGGHLYIGRPAKLIRPLTDEELAYFSYSAEHYVKLARDYQQG
ncbi:carbonic anhydrase, family 3 [Sulfuriferula multivorans]|uniref:Carbonic anhydrase, family 3 n=2 Tax=Sulfuriferula multivorans TaxID=1559896 RepID=A0A401JB11_9PROT|nr:carbonic anhydrase, family 3 [Sulfuriferula multivorans]